MPETPQSQPACLPLSACTAFLSSWRTLLLPLPHPPGSPQHDSDDTDDTDDTDNTGTAATPPHQHLPPSRHRSTTSRPCRGRWPIPTTILKTPTHLPTPTQNLPSPLLPPQDQATSLLLPVLTLVALKQAGTSDSSSKTTPSTPSTLLPSLPTAIFLRVPATTPSTSSSGTTSRGTRLNLSSSIPTNLSRRTSPSSRRGTIRSGMITMSRSCRC